MDFSSVPLYLDTPNWNQQQQPLQLQASGGSGDGEGPPIDIADLAAAPQTSEAGLSRPVSMAERARLVKIPKPEHPLKCPRCDSTNTKFCYFNNYSLSQPRHFCKTCRRYWTLGGALRNVPVGGGCRRNKRGKSSGNSAKSVATTDRQGAGTSSSLSTAPGGGGAGAGFPPGLPQTGQFPFLGSLHNLGGADYGAANLGLRFTGMPAVDEAAEFQVEQWRLPQIQQFPFLEGLEAPLASQAQLAAVQTMSGSYHFNGAGRGDDAPVSRVFANAKVSSSSLITQLASVKMEDSARLGFNFPRQYLSAVPRNEQYWSNSTSGGAVAGSGGGTWAADLSVFNSSSSHLATSCNL